LMREEHFDPYGSGKHEHPTAVGPEEIPLLCERGERCERRERREQVGKLLCESVEIVGFDAEVPVRPPTRSRVAASSRPDSRSR
jgi:hypothetical protein